ncbi:MAG: asparagine synthase-related protein [[Ruminococcus] lactaris]
MSRWLIRQRLHCTFLSEEASKKVKVVLSGEGSDELFGGYNIYCEPLEHTSFNKIPMPIRRFPWSICRTLPASWNERKRFPDASWQDTGRKIFCQCNEYFYRA